MAPGVEQRAARLQRMLQDLSCWSVRRWTGIDGWHEDTRPPGPDAALRVRTVRSPAITVPDDWDIEDTALELTNFGYGIATFMAHDEIVARYAVNEHHSRFRLPAPAFSARLQVSPVKPPALEGGYLTIGDVGASRLIWIDTPVDEMCRLLDLVIRTAVAVAGREPADELLDIAEKALAAVRWPTGAEDVRARLAEAEHFDQLWADVNVSPRPRCLARDERASVVAAIADTQARLDNLKNRWPGKTTVALLGSAHIDVAWLWPRTVSEPAIIGFFSSALSQLDRFPGARFAQSGALLYQILEQLEPAEFGRLRERVAGGRWELVGGMWVEPDAQLLTGESLVRQLACGQAFFVSRFGRPCKVSWLPDTFGFTGALPQLLADAGMEYFYTTKLNVNDTSTFPYDLCRWVGLDGTSVLAYLGPGPGGYRGTPAPRTILGTVAAFREKDRHHSVLLPLGHRAGIGPTDDELRRVAGLARIPALPTAEFASAEQFFTAAASAPDLPAWHGELYLEGKRGTYTTQGRTKVLHRAAEWALIDAEAAGALLALHGGPRPASLAGSWQSLLEHQAHDTVTGTSVAEVMATADAALADVAYTARHAADSATAALAGRLTAGDHLASRGGDSSSSSVFLLNPTLSPRPFRAFLPGQAGVGQAVAGGCVIATGDAVPALGARWLSRPVSPGVRVEDLVLENAQVRVELREDGTLGSVVINRSGAQVLAAPGNEFRTYLDRPPLKDAWEIAPDYHRFPLEPPRVTEIKTTERGLHRAAIAVCWRFRDSEIRQDIRLWANSPRIDFRTRIHWRERRVLLRTYFPTTIRTLNATAECAFGTIPRATAPDPARFEVPAHRFLDIFAPGCGAALLNNGRYGHAISDSLLSLTLLRSPIFPDPYADEGEHEFTYSLMPHETDWLSSGVLAEAADLNSPMPAARPGGAADGSWQGLSFQGSPLALGALKAAEAGDGLVLRVYEPAGHPGAVRCVLPAGWRMAAELSILEQPKGEPAFGFRPYQVRTWLLRHAACSV
jgi:alpha-mannosidase